MTAKDFAYQRGNRENFEYLVSLNDTVDNRVLGGAGKVLDAVQGFEDYDDEEDLYYQENPEIDPVLNSFF